MAKVYFKYDLKKDACNWVRIAKKKGSTWGMEVKKQVGFVPPPLLNQIRKNDFKKSENLVYQYLINHPQKQIRKAIVNSQIEALGKSWGKIENVYFKLLAKVFQKPIYTKEFTCYITSGFMCPYNPEENWFMASIWHAQPVSMTVIAHELMHLQFIHYYWDFLEKQGLTREKIEDLKESLTFLLNEPEFEKLILSEDKGYPNHQELRRSLKKVWRKEKDFKRFLDKTVEIMRDK